MFMAMFFVAAPAFCQQTSEQLAAYYFNNGNFAEAAQLYESLYKRTSNKYYYQRLLSSYVNDNQYRDAIKLVEDRKRTNPNELSLYVDEGHIYLLQRQDKRATRCFNKAIESLGTNLQPVPDLAQAFSSVGRYDYAVQTYKTIRQKTHNNYLYFNELVGLYQLMGDYEAMTREYFDLLDNQPSMLSSVQISMQRTLQEAPDDKLGEGVKRALVDRVRRHPENRTYLEMMVWFSLQQNDFEFAMDQAEAVEARFPDMGSELVMRVAKIAQNNDAYDVASRGYRHLVVKGVASPYYFDSRVGELEVEYARLNKAYSVDSKSVLVLKDKFLSALAELGKTESTVPLMRHYAELVAYHSDDIQSAVDMLDDALEIRNLKPHLRDEVKLDLGDMLLFAGQSWDASLLYMQVDKANKNDAIGAMAKFRNAKLSYYSHDFKWAKSQLDVLRASTSKLVANDAMELSLLISDNMEDDSSYTTLAVFADADLLLFRQMLDSAWAMYDRVAFGNLSHPLLDDVLLRKAQIRMKQARYTEADSLLNRLVEFYPYDITADDALFLRAQLNEDKLDRQDVARQCYEKILLDYPSSLYVDQARKRYNALKTK